MGTNPTVMQLARAVHDEVSATMERSVLAASRAIKDEFAKRLADQERKSEERIRQLERRVSDQLQTIVSLLKSLPAPNVAVNVPKGEPPRVDVHVPKAELPMVNVEVQVPKQEPPRVDVHVPKQDVPDVNVHVPKQDPPTVTVIVPPPRLIKKRVEYDADSARWDITEEEVDGEDNETGIPVSEEEENDVS